jgi:MoxR-like ATPase
MPTDYKPSPGQEKTMVTNSAPEPYLADAEQIIAAEVAIRLGKPLLLTGEPGTGKTSFAKYIAEVLAPQHFGTTGSLPYYEFITKSSSVANDLFYRFDNLLRFHASHDAAASKENRDYITFEALGKAILFTNEWDQVKDLIPDQRDHPGAGRSVVLIDEIDKAPRDFPNDILMEVDKLKFRIPELLTKDKDGQRTVREVATVPQHRPILVLTSNSEKNLPSAFLRRCVFHHITFPKDATEMKKRLAEIIKTHMGDASGPLVDDAIEVCYRLRESRDIDKKPATAELVDWVRTLRGMASCQTSLSALDLGELRGRLGVLAKSSHDLVIAGRVLEAYHSGKV